MSTAAGDGQMQAPIGRTLSIEALDGYGAPAGAEIDVVVNGAPAGRIDLGTGTRDPVSLEVSDGHATVELRAAFLAQTQTLVLPPGQDHATFQFSGSVRFAVGRKPVAYCPDGSSGSPCVTCFGRDGVKWRMCC